MTRFARAKGSKASNERVVEQATPWSEMKQQLLQKNKETEENKKRKSVINQRDANYKAFLEEKQKTESSNTTWAEFPGVSKPKQNKKLKEKMKFVIKNASNKNGIKVQAKQGSKINENLTLSKVNQTINNKGRTDSDSDAPPEELSAKNEVAKPHIKIKKPKQKRSLIILTDKKCEIELGKNKNEENANPTKERKTHEGKESKKIKLRKVDKSDSVNMDKNAVKKPSDEVIQKKNAVKENLTEKDLRKIEKKKQRRLKQIEKKKKIKLELKKQQEEINHIQGSDGSLNTASGDQIINKSWSKRFNNSNQNRGSTTAQLPKDRKPKVRDKMEHSRKKPFLTNKMFINGKELDIQYVDGFPIKKEDAERLKKLRKEMVSKGLPRSEITIALKLERRKAEKALARERKKVCFNCRKSGHNLSECPELNKNQVAQTAGSGICFKCGSTEHTHFECKVVRGQEFKFAQCFICNEQGHIARQCPDNARGLYPKGGACKVCGDVTHLKKDCPKFQEQQQRQESTIKVETFGDSNPDILEENSEKWSKKLVDKKPNKIIKF